jgi:hypothetical protein
MPTYEEPPSARQIGLRQARIVWNRAAVGAITLGMADAVQQVMEAILADASASAPRDAEAAAKRGVPMLKDTGSVSVFAGGVNKSGKAASVLVSGTAERTQAGNKPRGAKTPVDQVVGFVMFGSPLAHLLELGTVKMNAHPFLIPAFNRNVGGLAGIVVPAIGKRLAGTPQSIWARNPRTAPPAVSDSLMAVLRAEAAKGTGQ